PGPVGVRTTAVHFFETALSVRRPDGAVHTLALTGDSMTRRTAMAIFSALGYSVRSSGGLKGIWTSGVVTRRMGATRSPKAFSTTMAEISLAALHVVWAGSATTRRPVFATDLRMVSRSSGTRLRGSTTSTEIPSGASFVAAAMAWGTAPAM